MNKQLELKTYNKRFAFQILALSKDNNLFFFFFYSNDRHTSLESYKKAFHGLGAKSIA